MTKREQEAEAGGYTNAIERLMKWSAEERIAAETADPAQRAQHWVNAAAYLLAGQKLISTLAPKPETVSKPQRAKSTRRPSKP